MTEKEIRLLRYTKLFEESRKYLEEKYKRVFKDEFLSALLGHFFERDDVHMFLIFKDDLETIDLSKILETEFESVQGEIEFNSDSFDFLLIDKLEKATIKNNGYKWIIFKNDPDPFPSNPHAHEFSLNVKLHLGNGDMYRNNKKVGSMGKNEFLKLRDKIHQRGIQLPNAD